ncbi:MAG: hypothetical protein Q8N26_22760 [Myxococcales bacterium]|nr:hypothetical protein [Myxococcales bacterium]
MKQAPLFRRQFFVQRSTPGAAVEPSNGTVEYVRIHGNPSNPGGALDGRRVKLTRGGMLDVVAEARGGAGLGRVSYADGLRAGLKRGEAIFTYRFEVPATATEGQTFAVSVWGSDVQPAFRFTIEIAGSQALVG